MNGKYSRLGLAFAALSFWVTKPLWADFYCANTNATIRLKTADSKLILGAPLNFSGTLSLRDNSMDSVLGNKINFTQGVLQAGNLSTNFTGNYDTTTIDKILLAGDNSLDVQVGTITVPIFVSGTNNTISGNPQLTQEITLQDQNTSLQIAIRSNLTKNINLNQGTLLLGADLKLADGVWLVGPGTIDFAGNQLGMGVMVMTCTTDMIFSNDANISLATDVALNNCSWTFADVAGFSVINGNSNAIDLGANGRLILAPNHVLWLNNVVIRGLGDAAGEGNFVLANDDSIVVMRNAKLDFASNFTLTQGQFYLQGADSVFVVRNATFNIINNAILSVDHVALVWDPLSIGNSFNCPILPAASSNQQLINGGYIRCINSTSQPLSIFSSSSSLSSNFDITAATPLIFNNPDPATTKPITVNGNGNYMQFPRSATDICFTVQPGVALTLSNIVLKDFNPSTIALGAGAELILGDNTIVELGKDTFITIPLVIGGSAEFNGYGCSLTLVHNNSLVIKAPSKTFKLQNLSLHGAGDVTRDSSTISRLRMMYPDDKIILEDTKLHLNNDLLIDCGSVDIQGLVQATGNGSCLIYTSSGSLTVLPDSMLFLDQGVTFSYAPDLGITPENGTAQTYEESRKCFVLAAPSSVLYLNGATLHSSHTGMVLDTGTLLVGDHSVLKSVAGIDESNTGQTVVENGEEPILKSSLSVKILAGAVFDVQGRVIYE